MQRYEDPKYYRMHRQAHYAALTFIDPFHNTDIQTIIACIGNKTKRNVVSFCAFQGLIPARVLKLHKAITKLELAV